VTEGGPAKKAGIETGDVIVSFDGKEINDANELPLIVAATAVGKTAKIEIIRNGNKRTLDIKVGELKDEEEKSYQKKESGNSNDNELGLTVGDITPEMAREYNLTEKSGVIILQVDSGSLAEEVGLQPGDIVVEIDMEKITNTNQFNKKIKGYKAGVTILLLVKREGSSLFLTLKVEK
jgi:serine protease Do